MIPILLSKALKRRGSPVFNLWPGKLVSKDRANGLHDKVIYSHRVFRLHAPLPKSIIQLEISCRFFFFSLQPPEDMVLIRRDRFAGQVCSTRPGRGGETGW